MAWYPPRFNLWCQIWRPTGLGDNYNLIGYSLCQLRGPTSHIDAGGGYQEILFPLHTDVRGIRLNGEQGQDIVVVAGWDRRWCYVSDVYDKGAGFVNEYRLATCYWRGGVTVIPPVPAGVPVVDPELIPPDGYTPVPLLTPSPWPTANPF